MRPKRTTYATVVPESTSSISSHFYYECEDVQISHSREESIFRAQLFILDYKQFKAARIIQKNIRGWLVRRNMDRQVDAAITIQKAWGAYLGRRQLIKYAQERAQADIAVMYNFYIRKIQALFRGWYSRKHKNNMIFLKTIQLQALENILECMACRLHTMRRTGDLPGVWEFSDTDCHSKIEDFLTTTIYRMYNRYVGNKWNTNKALLNAHRRNHLTSYMYTSVPYPGITKDSLMFPLYVVDRAPRLYELREFDVAQRLSQYQESHKRVSHRKRKDVIIYKKQNTFCEDVIESMCRWPIFRDSDMLIDKEMLKADKFGSIIDDIRGFLFTLNYEENCNCPRNRKQENYSV